MDELVALLGEIVRAEYAQWMRYVYLSSLGYGLDTDQLTSHFEEHASDELEHAYIIRRWLVDLGGMPPTDVPVIEPFFGSIDDAVMWLFEAEVEGLELYTVAHELANSLGMFGLVNDIETNMSSEHEHMSDLQHLVQPHLAPAGMTTIVVMANKFRRFAAAGGEFFQDLVVDKIIGLYARTGRKLAQVQHASLNDYLTSMFDEASYKAYQKFGDDTQKIKEELPSVAYDLIKEDVENTVRDLWKNKHKPEAKSGLEFYKEVYQWLNSPEVKDNWEAVFEQYNPKWKMEYYEDWQKDLDPFEDEPYEPYQPTMEQIFQELQPQPEEPVTEEAVTIDDPEFQQEYEQWSQQRQPAPETVEQAPQEVQQEQAPKKDRRPVTEEIEQKIKILDPDTKERTLEVGVGDRVYNQTAAQIFKQNRDYGINRNQANQYATGVIKEIRDNDIVVEIPGLSDEDADTFGEQIWPIEHNLWGSREEGQRLVNAMTIEEN